MSDPQTPDAPQPGPAQPSPPQPGPPPHPYAAGAPRRAGRGLAIAAMALGLLAVLTVLVSAFYGFTVTLPLGVLLGLAALVLGIVALVKRQPKGPGIVGVAGGAVSLIAALVAGAFVLGSLATGALAREGEAAAPSAPTPSAPSSPEPGAEAAPGASETVLTTGGVVFAAGGPEGITVLPTERAASGVSPQEIAPPARADGTPPAAIRLYLDYRCPYCAMFEEANEDRLESLVESGDAVVELVPLTFLDRVSAGSRYSSRAAAAMTCVAAHQPDAAWDAHQALIDTDFQPAEGTTGHDDGAIVAELADEADGLADETRACIADGALVDRAQELSDWVFANAVPGAADPATAVTGTPFVLVNGVAYAGAPNSAAEFDAFLAEQGVGRAASGSGASAS
ncbi:thioredoxin domain-containing protein [Leucobacter allii]|uniref:DsbA family protein n=1 Tax=Leucobacter allii TaxID=2932247 RepID=UPI001FD578D9|nr:thioredoxin domain-containing protein [Leucobacter allii]UOR00636.1 thioredoxin domain-containing protein [Leucobacter allii]